jgi:type 1 glutamine amidotransferase
MAHPPIGRYKVRNTAPEHPLVAGIGTFFVEDEHYLQDVDPDVQVLLSSRFAGRTEMFERADWPDGEQPILYLKPHGPGAVLYLTLGHARGRYDMRPISDRYPFVERGAWTLPVFQELLRRGLRWALGEG